MVFDFYMGLLMYVMVLIVVFGVIAFISSALITYSKIAGGILLALMLMATYPIGKSKLLCFVFYLIIVAVALFVITLSKRIDDAYCFLATSIMSIMAGYLGYGLILNFVFIKLLGMQFDDTAIFVWILKIFSLLTAASATFMEKENETTLIENGILAIVDRFFAAVLYGGACVLVFEFSANGVGGISGNLEDIIFWIGTIGAYVLDIVLHRKNIVNI